LNTNGIMSRRQVFILFYYTQLPLITMAMVLTGSISAVLYQTISWPAILLVGLSTFFAYSIDNLIDWKKDRLHYQTIAPMVVIYHQISYVLIPASAIAVILLVLKSPEDLRIGILLLGATVAMGIARIANYRSIKAKKTESVLQFTLNRLFISLIWTIVTIFVPIWYDQHPIITQTWRTAIYMFLLIFNYSVIWKFEKSSYQLKKELISARIFLVLAVMSLLAVLLAIFDVIQGLFPLASLVSVLPPLACLVGLQLIVNSPIMLRRKITWLTILLAFLTIFVAVMHVLAS
jgi:hypothetical protein